MKQNESSEKEKKPDMRKRAKRKGKAITYLVPDRPPLFLRPAPAYYDGKLLPMSENSYLRD